MPHNENVAGREAGDAGDVLSLRTERREAKRPTSPNQAFGSPSPNVRQIAVDNISVIGDRRPIDEDVVDRLAQNIQEIGLRVPITVRRCLDTDPEGVRPYVLVAGAHRLAAMRKLSRTVIAADLVEWDAATSELWEISENLHRLDLTKQERDKAIRRYAEVLKERDLQSRQTVAIEESSKRRDGRGHRHEGIAKKIAAQTGANLRTVQRALAPAKPRADRKLRRLNLLTTERERKSAALQAARIIKENVAGKNLQRLFEALDVLRGVKVEVVLEVLQALTSFYDDDDLDEDGGDR